MQRINASLGLARQVRIANVWLLTTSTGKRVLVDTGHAVERGMLRWQLRRAGITRRGDLDAILLTHRHSDHAGNAAWLRRDFDCPVVCHTADAVYLMGQHRPPKLARPGVHIVHKMLCHLEDRAPARVVVDEAIESGLWKWGIRVFHVPGHTSGSVLLHHEASRTLFTGDTILSGPAVVRATERLRFAVRDFSEDVDLSMAETRRALAELPATETLCAGHGPAVTTHTHSKLMKLAATPATPAFRLGR